METQEVELQYQEGLITKEERDSRIALLSAPEPKTCFDCNQEITFETLQDHPDTEIYSEKQPEPSPDLNPSLTAKRCALLRRRNQVKIMHYQLDQFDEELLMLHSKRLAFEHKMNLARAELDILEREWFEEAGLVKRAAPVEQSSEWETLVTLSGLTSSDLASIIRDELKKGRAQVGG